MNILFSHTNQMNFSIFFYFLLYLTCVVNCGDSDSINTDKKPRPYDLKQARRMFTDFARSFNKKYEDNDEFEQRLGIFTDNLKYINRLNERSRSTVFGITKLLDLHQNETLTHHACLRVKKRTDRLSRPAITRKKMRSAPKNWDWREHNAVTTPGQQSSCGSCWAFAANSIVESQYAIRHNNLVNLSVQQFVDCSGWENGCTGGYMDDAITKQGQLVGGIVPTEKYYPYQAKKLRCWVNRKDVVARVNFGNMLHMSEKRLKKFIYNYGPVAAGIIFSWPFAAYKSGIGNKDDLDCPDTHNISHAVVIVGYGVENGTKYWIIKNSDGTGYGMDGYMLLERGGNHCKINDYVVEAIIK